MSWSSHYETSSDSDSTDDNAREAKITNLKSEICLIMELMFQDVVYSLIKIKLPDNFLKHNNFYVKITARQNTPNKLENRPDFSSRNNEKKQTFKKEANIDYKKCSQKLIGLVTSILFKNKVILFETIDDWVTRDIMPLIPDLENTSESPLKTQNYQNNSSYTTVTLGSPTLCSFQPSLENVKKIDNKTPKSKSLNKYFPTLGWRLDHNKIFENSQKVIPKVRAFFAKMIRNYFTIDYSTLKSNTAGFNSPVTAKTNLQLELGKDRNSDNSNNTSKSSAKSSSQALTEAKVPYEIKNWIIIASIHVIGVIIIECYNNKVLHKHRNYTFSMIRVVSVALTDYIISNYMYFFELCGWESLQNLNFEPKSQEKARTDGSNEQARSRSSRPRTRLEKVSALGGHKSQEKTADEAPKLSKSKTSASFKKSSSSANNYSKALSDDDRYSSALGRKSSTDTQSTEDTDGKTDISDYLPGVILAAGLALAAFLGAERLKKF